MNPEEQIKEWIIKNTQTNKEFYVKSIIEDLKLDEKVVIRNLVILEKQSFIRNIYTYVCECRDTKVYKSFSDILEECPICKRELDFKRLYVHFEVIK